MTAMISPSALKTATTTNTGVKSTAAVMPAIAKQGATTISSIPVRAIPVPNTNKLILAGPYIVLRTATVAEQVQALRQEKKVSSAATPASQTDKTESPAPELLRCKRRADLGKLGFPEAKPLSVSRRNARERNRVKLVNQGFDTLREHVPNGKKNRKMSKVDTLKSAVDYIRQLQEMIDEHDKEMDVCSGETSVHDDTITADSSPLADRTCQEPVSQSPKNSLSPTPTEDATMTDASVVKDAASENMLKDHLNNNNNNNSNFVNFNVDNNKVVSSVSDQVDMDTVDGLHQLSNVEQLNTLQLVNLNQISTVHQANALQGNNEVQLNNRQQVHAAQQVNTVNARQLLSNLNTPNTSTFNTTAFLTTAYPPSSTSSSSQTSTTASPLPQTITLITLPLHPQPPPISPGSTDDVFLPETRPRIRTTAPTSQGTMTTGTIATLTTLQGVGSLSGQGLTISQPCRRHLSFSEPEAERTVHIQPRLSLSDQSVGSPTNQHQQQHQHQQQQQPSTSSHQHVSFTLLPGHTVGDLTLLNGNLNSNALTLGPRPIDISIDQQQPPSQQQQPPPPPEQPQFTTLANLALPSQSVSAAFSLDQSSTGGASLPLTDNHGYHHQEPFQTLVAPSNVAMKQPQLVVDQVPSPSLSTSSSHTSESSYESYESLGSLEEDLQDISNWITELCNSAQDINAHCDTDEGVDFLTYNDTDNL